MPIPELLNSGTWQNCVAAQRLFVTLVFVVVDFRSWSYDAAP